MPFVQAGDARLYYELHGREPADAPALVFAHGAGGNHLSWWQQVPHFRGRYACLVFDHRGFGASHDAPDGPGGAAFVDDLRALLDHAGIGRATLVAQSMGGWTCLRFALRCPERVERLVMCDTHGGLATDTIGAELAKARNAASALPDGVHPAAGARMFREQPALHFLYTQIDALNTPRTPRDLGRLLRAAGSVTPDEMKALDVPVLLIAGAEDIIIPPRVLELVAAQCPRARVELVAGAGHSVYFERPRAFNRIVDNFLEGGDAHPA